MTFKPIKLFVWLITVGIVSTIIFVVFANTRPGDLVAMLVGYGFGLVFSSIGWWLGSLLDKPSVQVSEI